MKIYKVKMKNGDCMFVYPDTKKIVFLSKTYKEIFYVEDVEGFLLECFASGYRIYERDENLTRVKLGGSKDDKI